MYNYKVYNLQTEALQDVIGSKIQEYKGIKFFVNKSLCNSKRYVCTEVTTSAILGSGSNTAAKAIAESKANIDRLTAEKLQAAIASNVKLLQSKGIETPINTCEGTKVNKLYLKHVRTGRVIQAYEQKEGYYIVTKDEYKQTKAISDKYYMSDTGIVEHITRSRLENPNIISQLNKMLSDGTIKEVDKKTYDAAKIEQCKQRLQHAINNKDYIHLLSILRNNDNKHSIKAMAEIMGESLPTQQKARIHKIQQWLGKEATF